MPENKIEKHSTLVVSIGSPVMQDDGAGYHTLSLLINDGVKADFADLGTDIFRLRLFFKNHKRIIIIDALRGASDKYKPGDVMTFPLKDFSSKLCGKIKSAHTMGSIDAVEIMIHTTPGMNLAEFYLVGIVADNIDKGTELTNDVKNALPRAADAVKSLLLD